MNLLNKDRRRVISFLILVCFLAPVLISCATRPENIEADYISPSVYHNYTCQSLNEEHKRISHKVNGLYKKQKLHANKDIAVVGAALLIFPPTIFLMIGQDDKEEISFLKGEYEALEQAAIQKECPVAEVIASEKVAAQTEKEKSVLNVMKQRLDEKKETNE